MKTKNVITAIAVTACVGFAAPAIAGSAQPANSVEADISGLDLSTPEGRAKVESRIERAAKYAEYQGRIIALLCMDPAYQRHSHG